MWEVVERRASVDELPLNRNSIISTGQCLSETARAVAGVTIQEFLTIGTIYNMAILVVVPSLVLLFLFSWSGV